MFDVPHCLRGPRLGSRCAAWAAAAAPPEAGQLSEPPPEAGQLSELVSVPAWVPVPVWVRVREFFLVDEHSPYPAGMGVRFS